VGGSKNDGADVEVLGKRGEDLNAKGITVNVGRSVSSPSRFRLVGFFRSSSSSRLWGPPHAAAEEDADGADRATSPSVLVKKKKKKTRVLG
jgi:hypothetical protein